MRQTDEKIGKSKQHQQRPAKSGCLQSCQSLTDLTFHILRLANSIGEHYYNVSPRPGNSSVFGNLILQPPCPSCAGWRPISQNLGVSRWVKVIRTEAQFRQRRDVTASRSMLSLIHISEP